ncbi:MAG: S-adenosyl-l-methionine hydroxide adenosyltransferase family protein [Euryarchaeota archaeon]|nr:S-adenosyl-l-methionine hydroxide adenosyltransferase family protein [Euryarchaeota archaeon]
MRLITLTTDFGWTEYVGAMKGVIHSIHPGATIVDITHGVRRFDVRHGAYVIGTTYQYFPKGTIHCAVVDPGVGTERRGIIFSAGGHTFVGPDNGLFSMVGGVKAIYAITAKPKARTFWGRDVFAPASARLAMGTEPRELGRRIDGYERLEFRAGVSGRRALGEVICVDHFGDVITSLRGEHLAALGAEHGARLEVKIKGKKRDLRLLESYGHARKGELLCLVGSAGYLELAVNQGDAAARLGVVGGERIEVRL